MTNDKTCKRVGESERPEWRQNGDGGDGGDGGRTGRQRRQGDVDSLGLVVAKMSLFIRQLDGLVAAVYPAMLLLFGMMHGHLLHGGVLD